MFILWNYSVKCKLHHGLPEQKIINFVTPTVKKQQQIQYIQCGQ